MEPYIFISHSSKDVEQTEYIASKLQEAGYACWVDVNSIPEGSTWPREVEKGVRECSALMVILTENAKLSKWVEAEIVLALELQKRIYVARFDDVLLPIYLVNIQVTDFRKRPEGAFKRLLNTLNANPLEKPLQLSSLDKAKRQPRTNQLNFFKYIEQLPNGSENGRISRTIFEWADQNTDSISFSGRTYPAFSSHIWIGPGGMIPFTVRAYAKQPAIEIPLQFYADFPPYDSAPKRRDILKRINGLLPEAQQFDDTRIDGRPNIPLTPYLSDEKVLKALFSILDEMIQKLREADQRS